MLSNSLSARSHLSLKLAKPVYLCARGSKFGRSPRTGRVQREPQGYACQASKTAFRSRCARPDGTFCPNIQPRAHARLTGLTRLCRLNNIKARRAWMGDARPRFFESYALLEEPGAGAARVNCLQDGPCTHGNGHGVAEKLPGCAAPFYVSLNKAWGPQATEKLRS